VTTVVSCVFALGAAFLPWLTTGQTRRSAFALARSADALGFVDSPVRRALVVSWYLLPLLTATAWTAAALRRPAAVAAMGAVVGSMSIVAGSMFIALARPGPGPVSAVVGGAVAILSAGWLARSLSATRRASVNVPLEGSHP